jgi:uncharacterized protein YkwD
MVARAVVTSVAIGLVLTGSGPGATGLPARPGGLEAAGPPGRLPLATASLPHCADADVAVTADTRARAEKAARCLVDKLRRRHGLRPLAGSDDLRRAAREHARDMVRRQYFSHVTPEGGTLTDRVRATGYLDGAAQWWIGENLAWGSGGRSTAAAVVSAWMDSPEHRANLLRGEYRRAGLFVVAGAPVRVSGNQGTYVQVLGGRR